MAENPDTSIDVVAAPQHCDPRLPPELERLVFEFAALARWSEIPKLMLVAWRVKDWIEPLLYRVIFLTAQWTPLEAQLSGYPTVPIDALLTAVSKKSDAFLDSAVHHIFFDFEYATKDQLPVSAMNLLLARCPHVASLFGPDISIHHPYDFRCLRRPALDLSTVLPHITGAFTVPYFRSVTHLELLNDDWEDDDDDDPDLGFRFWTELNLGNLTNQSAYFSDDDRFVLVRQTYWRVDWLRGADGGEEFWALADEFIAARRAGKVDRSLYSISDADHSWRT
ncbi:hypothetical protein DFH06DRAFT_1318784 [Mycena polygramma]|nr:hypothetical protein DFH06DRAFT_1318784 [Mycena polygramma]